MDSLSGFSMDAIVNANVNVNAVQHGLKWYSVVVDAFPIFNSKLRHESATIPIIKT
jgi:hypothetical protein